MNAPTRRVHPEVADEIAAYLERRADALAREEFHMTDREESVRLRALAKALKSENGEPAFDYVRTFSVEGQYPFPIDLLREYQCVPATPQDSTRLARIYDDATKRERICLLRLTRCADDGCRTPVAGWFEAFEAAGWRVVGDGR